MRSLLIALPLLGAACTERDLGSLSESDAASLYVMVRSELKNVHSLVLGGGMATTAPYDYGCASGLIEVRVSLDEDMQPASLRHEFDKCAIDSVTLDGRMDYVNLDPCGDDYANFAFSTGARIDIAGSMNGFCYLEVRDQCGEVSGHICGYPADEVLAQP